MRHLKKFNESSEEKYLEFDRILKDVFADLIDDKTIQVQFTNPNLIGVSTRMGASNDIEFQVNIRPWVEDQMMSSRMTPEQMVQRYEKLLELTKDIEVCYKRALEELNTTGRLSVDAQNRINMAFAVPGVKKEDFPF